MQDNIGFIVASDLAIPPLFGEELDSRGVEVITVPLHINFGEEHYLDGVNISTKKFYTKMIKFNAKTGNLPTTSQPNPAEFAQAYDQILRKGINQALVLPLLKQYSGTYNSAREAIKHSDLDARVIETKTAQAGIGFMIMKAYQMFNQGESVDSIADTLNDFHNNISISLFVNDPNYLADRVPSVVGYIVDTLKLKLALKVEDGTIKPIGARRTQKKALDLVFNQFEESMQDKPFIAYAVHAGNLKLGEQINDRLLGLNVGKNPYVPQGVLIEDLCAALGRYVGPDGAGIIACTDPDLVS